MFTNLWHVYHAQLNLLQESSGGGGSGNKNYNNAQRGNTNRYLERETMQLLSQTHIQSPISFEMQRHGQFRRQASGVDQPHSQILLHNQNHPTFNYQVRVISNLEKKKVLVF